MIKFLLCVLSIPACVLAQNLEIRPATELIFPTAPDKGFTLESSPDLKTWTIHQAPLLASTGVVHRLVSADNARRFFKLSVHDVQDVSSVLETIRAANKVPGLACAVVLSNRMVALGAAGLRKAGVPAAPVTVHDKWHQGSLTKSMTATVAAMLVEEGKISWDTTLAEVFPEFAPKMNALWREVTLDWLCSNRSGAPENLVPSGIWTKLQAFEGTPTQGRRLLLELLTVLEPNHPPGTTYEYSNAGFSLAGHMLETVAQKSWEDLMTERLFVPLGMTSAGFGVPATPRYIDQPWGHQLASGSPLPIEPGPAADNPPAIGPSGTVHCSVIDLARYVGFHLAGHADGTALLKQPSFAKLHTALANNANYAYGWNVVERPWARGSALQHAGSNTTWFSVIWMAPNAEFGVVVVCNLATASGPNPGATATDQVAAKMIQTFLN